MFYIADLHVHSHYSRATSKDLNLESLYQWACIKGIHIVGTGDFTHPQWFQELKEKLVPDGSGLYRLKNPPKTPAISGVKCQALDVRFCLTTEISSIYKQGDKVRKNHNLLYAPDLDTVARINAKLATIGNLAADGRPILGLPARDLLEIVLEASDRAHLIPAHIWTPWFSTLGSKSGYDSIQACFRDLTDHIFALETGLSSDPAMNWRLSELDRYTMVSNSDAHSPQKLGREANLFDTDMTYDAMFTAIKTCKGFLGTLEFFPEEGKYHMDGHRKCGVCTVPTMTQQYKGLCPACGKPLTVGVLHRVEKLANRQAPQKPPQAADFEYIVPLPEIIAEIKNMGPNSKGVQQRFRQIIAQFGSEFTFLREAPIEDIQKLLGPVYAEAIQRVRNHIVNLTPGYDGTYGVIQIFHEGEIASLTGQLHCFQQATATMTPRVTKQYTLSQDLTPQNTLPSVSVVLNTAQRRVKEAIKGATLVKAGPGTGKTQALMHWIVNCLQEGKAQPQHILAVTFTNKAADEMRERLTTLLGDQVRGMQIGTFHAIGYQMLQARYPTLKTVYDAEDRRLLLPLLFPEREEAFHKKLAHALPRYFESGESKVLENIEAYAATYQDYLQQRQAVDLSAIISQVLNLWEKEPQWLEQYNTRYAYIAVDEFQDINPLQYRFIQLLGNGKNIVGIGDPDQAIYGFRGADVQLFFRFKEDFNAKEIRLEQNYRSTGCIVQAAEKLIQHNTLNSGLHLQANNAPGVKIKLFEATNAQAEAHYVKRQIKTYVGGIDNLAMGTHDEGDYAFSDIAILFRTRAVGHVIFSQFTKAGIPTHFSDGSSFLATPPFCIIADILRLYVHPTDIVALHSFLTHGLQWEAELSKKLLPITHTTSDAWMHEVPAYLSIEQQKAYNDWLTFYRSLAEAFQRQGVAGAVKAILKMYLPDNRLDEGQRLQKETILTLAKEAQADVAAFLEKMTLTIYTDAGRIQGEGIHLLTFHAAKGLEFPVVFIVGAEEGITPVTRKGSDLEEERRLFYVALTRTKEAVHITHVQKRLQYSQEKPMQLSRFVKEIPQNLIDKVALQPLRKAVKASKKQLTLF